MKQPSEADIRAAKEYVKERIETEQSMSALLEKAMREAAERIVSICYLADVNPQNFRYEDLPLRAQYDIDEVIRWLQDTVDDYFRTFAIADHEENQDEFIPLVFGENHGMTFAERLEDYCGKYKDELMLLVGAGLFLGIGKLTLVKSIGDNLRHPYANHLLAEGIAAPITYGRGKTNSMLSAIDNLTRYGIAEAWMKNQYINNRKDGCLGWWVKRGSSYPCELCDSYVGFHDDESELPPYHGHCACIAVPVYL